MRDGIVLKRLALPLERHCARIAFEREADQIFKADLLANGELPKAHALGCMGEGAGLRNRDKEETCGSRRQRRRGGIDVCADIPAREARRRLHHLQRPTLGERDLRHDRSRAPSCSSGLLQGNEYSPQWTKAKPIETIMANVIAVDVSPASNIWSITKPRVVTSAS
jgi:hypothetical protein